MTGFDMRAKAPLYANEPFRIAGRPREEAKSCDPWAITPQNTVAMEAVASFA